jgi:hypothetical protein
MLWHAITIAREKSAGIRFTALGLTAFAVAWGVWALYICNNNSLVAMGP